MTVTDKVKTSCNVAKKQRSARNILHKDNINLTIMLIPTIVLIFLFCYLPMFGLVIAFKNYRYNLGILGSDWAGFENFKYFFSSQDAWILVRNTIGYNIIFIIANIVSGVGVALLFYEVKSRTCLKYYQTTMLFPHFMSWIIVGFIVYAFLDPSYGVLNKSFGIDINWYTKPAYWPAILVFANTWKSIGMNSIYYYAALMSIDPTLFEAARIDGATSWQITRYIKIPELRRIIAIMIILATGSIFKGDFGLFYQLPMDVGALYPVTDVIDTYLYRGLRSGDVGVTTAVGLFQSVVGLATVLLSNYIVKKIDEDSSMF